MRVSVRQAGGVLGIDREVAVDGTDVRVHDRGAEVSAGSLDDAARGEIERLAYVVKTATVTASEGAVYDAMTTVIVIDDGASSCEVVVRSGDEAPPELWQLVNLVNAAPTRAT